MEKKLEMHGIYQGDKLLFMRKESKEKMQFMREELQQKMVLESRQLDLEFMRMEQEHQDSRNRELAL